MLFCDLLHFVKAVNFDKIFQVVSITEVKVSNKTAERGLCGKQSNADLGSAVSCHSQFSLQTDQVPVEVRKMFGVCCATGKYLVSRL